MDDQERERCDNDLLPAPGARKGQRVGRCSLMVDPQNDRCCILMHRKHQRATHCIVQQELEGTPASGGIGHATLGSDHGAGEGRQL